MAQNCVCVCVKTQREGYRSQEKQELYLSVCVRVRQSERDASPTGRHYTASTPQPPQTPQPASMECQQAWPLGNTGQQETAPWLKDKQHLIILTSSFGRLDVTSIQKGHTGGGFEPQDKGWHHNPVFTWRTPPSEAPPLSCARTQRSDLENEPSKHPLIHPRMLFLQTTPRWRGDTPHFRGTLILSWWGAGSWSKEAPWMRAHL